MRTPPLIHIIIMIIAIPQIIVKIVAFRLKYFTNKFEVFDGIVVVVSWVLDIASMYVQCMTVQCTIHVYIQVLQLDLGVGVAHWWS